MRRRQAGGDRPRGRGFGWPGEPGMMPRSKQKKDNLDAPIEAAILASGRGPLGMGKGGVFAFFFVRGCFIIPSSIFGNTFLARPS